MMKYMILFLCLMVSFAAKSQHKVITGSVPEELVGKWVPQNKPEQGEAIESISFFANGKINIDSKKSKVVQGFNASKEHAGYDIQLTDLINGSELANFKVLFVTDSTMAVNMQGKQKVRNLVLKKIKNDKYRVIPLKGK